VRPFILLRSCWDDVRFAVRQLRHAPAFTLTAIVTLALGTGVNTGIFSIINGLGRPLPVADADRLVVLAAEEPGDVTGFRYHFSYPTLLDYRRQGDVFTELFAWDVSLAGLTIDRTTNKFIYSQVTNNFFSGLGLSPAVGRLFRPGEGEHIGADPIVVLGHSYWLRRFGGAADVIDRQVRINGIPARIVGVAPKGFRGLFGVVDLDGYMLLGAAPVSREMGAATFEDRAATYLTVAGRLKPGVTISQAQAAVDVLARQLSQAYPAALDGTRVRVVSEPLARPIPVPFVATTLPLVQTLMFVLSWLVLVLACLNVANLLLVRATVRERELAIRAALGSGRARLMRLLMIEGMLLAITSAAIGAVLGRFMTVIPSRVIGSSVDITFSVDNSFDWRVFVYIFATAITAALLLGLVPALRASRVSAIAALRGSDRTSSAGRGRQRVRHALVAAQLAGSLVILVAAGLFVRGLQRSAEVDVGFDPNNLVTMAMDPAQVGYDRTRAEAFYQSLEDRVRRLPGVERAAFSLTVPMGYVFSSCPVEAETATSLKVADRLSASYNIVGSGYFDTLRLPVVSGRVFDERDETSAVAVTVVNETLAARLWPGQNAVGKRVRVACSTNETLWEVIGVAADSKYVVPFEPPLPMLYSFLTHLQPTIRVLQVRTTMPTAEIVTRVTNEVRLLDPDIGLFDIRTMNQVIAGAPSSAMFRVGGTQAATMGLVALALAVVGLYGVVSYGASQRVRETGIRLALGADRAQVGRLILRQGAGMVIGGLTIGLAVSVGLTILVTRFLTIVSAVDPLLFGIAVAGLVAVAFIACYLPARRAMQIDPAAALRTE
jgi:predicted permease